MGSIIGVAKVAAKRIGISYEEYEFKIANGFKWCTFGKHWQDYSMFAPDSYRGSGKSAFCHSCRNGVASKRKKKIRSNKWRNKEKSIATLQVFRAIKSGKLVPPGKLSCSHCGHIGEGVKHEHEYHHHKGYDPKYWLDVIPLCKLCHSIETRKEHGLETYRPPERKEYEQNNDRMGENI